MTPVKIIRNDDVAFDTDVTLLKEFTELCNRYDFRVMHAITLIGKCIPIQHTMGNGDIRTAAGDSLFLKNEGLVTWLLSRKHYDEFAVHGLWHTHHIPEEEICYGKLILEGLGLTPTYYVPPFNEYEGEYADGLPVCGKECHRLESLIDQNIFPQTEIAYVHSWRFNGSWYTLSQLESALKKMRNV